MLVFSCEFYKILKSIFLAKHLRATASECDMSKLKGISFLNRIIYDKLWFMSNLLLSNYQISAKELNIIWL